MTETAIVVRPVTAARWPAFAALFSARGCPGSCWCTPYRFRDAHLMDRDDKRAAMQAAIRGGVPVGVLAFDGDDPVGWCSVAPRSSYAKLARSRTMPMVDIAAWTILCLFVRREHRRQGVAHALLDGAVAYARAGGATVVEAYPWDTAGITSTHRGHSRLYASAGFTRDAGSRRWTLRLAA